MEADLNYYRRRSLEELEAAASAADAKVRSIHLELGRRYEEKTSRIEAELRRGRVHLVATG